MISRGDSGSPLRMLDGARSVYWLPTDDVVEEVLNPALGACDVFELMSGYFSGNVLREMAPGLASYLINTGSPLRMLVSPVISNEDQEMVRAGVDLDRVAKFALESAFEDQETLASALVTHTKNCLAYLLANGRLEIRVVLMKGGIFHPKQWTFVNGDDVAILSGSANATQRGVSANVEQLRFDRSWASDDSAYACAIGRAQFSDYWTNQNSTDGVSIEISQAELSGLLKEYHTSEVPSVEDYRRAVALENPTNSGLDPCNGFQIPRGLDWQNGPFAHQGHAVAAWEESDRRGILAIATGGGKTISSLVAAKRLSEEVPSLMIVVSAPTRLLVEQWCSEMAEFGLNPYRTTSGGTIAQHLREVDGRLLRLEVGAATVESAVVTNNTLASQAFRDLLVTHSARVLLIADEVHNLGTDAFLSDPPDVSFRMGLSATPERQYDDPGTAGLLRYFGPVVFEFGLSDAIAAGCLVPYDYFLHPTRLTDSEHETYTELTEKIKKLAPFSSALKENDGSPALQRLLEKRRLVLEAASSKIPLLRSLLVERGVGAVQRTLIYCTDKDPKQLEDVNSMLSELGITFHQITADETGDRALVAGVLRGFRSGDIQVITAKRVLDEGFNIPEISTAYLLASNTVRRQWVQRRGRILRTCAAIGKNRATLHDLLVLPPTDVARDADAGQLVRKELERCKQFAEISLNEFSTRGAGQLIQDIEHEYLVWTNGAGHVDS